MKKILLIIGLVSLLLDPCIAEDHDLNELVDGAKHHERDFNCPNIPEPSTLNLWLLGIGTVTVILVLKKRKK